MKTSDIKFAILGGGIGGLSLAIAMQQKGFTVKVYENARAWQPLGAGLGLAANAVRAFMELGIADDVLEAGRVLKKLTIKNEKGKVISETDSEKVSAKYGVVNNFSIHRSDLHNVLLRHIKPDTIELDRACIDFRQNRDGVTLVFSDGAEVNADFLLACDGINSVVRQKLLPSALPRYAGYTCWRAVIDDPPSNFNWNETSETWGKGARFGIVPLSNNRVYWFACLNAKPSDAKYKNYTVSDLMKHFGDFHFPIPELLMRTRNDQLIWNDINDIHPLTKFNYDKILLLGDAAHATTPNMGQGACMAIEDAVVIANCLENSTTVAEAFSAFENKRLSRTTKVINDSWRIGRVAQVENPVMATLRNAVIRLTPERVMEKQLEFIYQVSLH